jgi:hypothetical protein
MGRLHRSIKWLLAIGGLFVLCAAGLALVIAFIPGASKDEVARVSSPNGQIDAVLVETNGGATTSFDMRFTSPRMAPLCLGHVRCFCMVPCATQTLMAPTCVGIPA